MKHGIDRLAKFSLTRDMGRGTGFLVHFSRSDVSQFDLVALEDELERIIGRPAVVVSDTDRVPFAVSVRGESETLVDLQANT